MTAPLRRDGRRPWWAAVLVVLCCATGLTWPGAAAAVSVAAACPTADGVTVVIDFGRLGGGVQVGCATGLTAASRGSAALQGAGFSWSPPTNTPGFVCRIDGRPTIDETVGTAKDPGYTESCVDTPPGDASWSYWQSSGDGNWSYSTNGITSSRVRIGGFEGWVFGRGDGSPPDYRPVTPTRAPAPAPEPTPQPEPQPEPAPAPAPAPTSTSAAPPSTTTSTTTSRSSTSAASSSSASSTSTTTAPEPETSESVPTAAEPAETTAPTTATSEPATPDTVPTTSDTPSGTVSPQTPTTVTTTQDAAVDTVAADDTGTDAAALTVLGVTALIAVLVVGTVLIHRHRTARDDD